MSSPKALLEMYPELYFGFLIGDVSRMLRERFNQLACTLGLTQAQARALIHLSLNEGISQVELARLLEIQPITLGRQLDRLAKANLIERRTDPHDRRAWRLYLTPPGTNLPKEIIALVRDLMREGADGIGENALERLTHDLERIKQNLSKPDIDAVPIGTTSRGDVSTSM